MANYPARYPNPLKPHGGMLVALLLMLTINVVGMRKPGL